MGVEISMSSKVLLRHVISILMIISLEDRVAIESLKYGSCEPAECGDDMKGDHSGNDAKPCCRPEPLLKLEPFWEDLVHCDHQSLRLISEFERSGNACFAPPKLSPIPPGASDTDVPGIESNQVPSYLAFFRNCCSFPNVDYPNPYSTCPSGGANSSYVALLDRPQDPHLNLSACESHVFVPVKSAGKDREKIEHDGSEEKARV
ncbi:hypothetical protein NL676_037878 [Syzygium grande]|nr:hypothetical protein NL676_037878 [Syzygium grande]